MSLEQQLRFDISRCSLCPLGVNKQFCSPLIDHPPEILLLLEVPALQACEENNPWRSTAAATLKNAILHASGSDLSRYHLSYLVKCNGGSLWDGESAKTDRKKWAQTCSSQYLSWEIRSLRPRLALVFGEFTAEICFPDLQGKEKGLEVLAGKELFLEPWHVRSYAFENPLTLSRRGGLDSEAGLDYIRRLHAVLGGKLNLPQVKEEPNLFSLIN